MRPGMFDNARDDLREAFERTCAALPRGAGLPDVRLASEHFFDDVVFDRIVGGAALPYPALTATAASGKRSILVEFPTVRFPAAITHRFFDMMRRKIRPVIAHPERYEPVWDDPAVLEPLLDAGAVLQLDVAALAGRYGRVPRRTAEALLSEGYYHAASSDAHSVRDVAAAKEGIELLFSHAGREEAEFLLIEGPRRILDGEVET
jgi:protein-tyrosine phosphatase